MADPQAQSCATCLRVALAATRSAEGRLPAMAAVTVVSPTGKAHWRDRDGYTFCGRFARGWGSDA